MKLNKQLPFATHLGDLNNDVKYVQDGHAFNATGKYLGEYDNGKLIKKTAKALAEETKAAEEEAAAAAAEEAAAALAKAENKTGEGEK